MNVHNNARLTLRRRQELIGRLEAGQPQKRVAGDLDVSVRTVRKWWRRYARRTSGGPRATESASAPALHRPGTTGPSAQRTVELDITKLLGPAKWTYFYLYVMLDVFSRYVVGWMIAHREGASLAETFIRETCARQGIDRGQLTIHADRGPAMTSKPVALLLTDLGVTKTHSRPHVSNDNPFSEAQFKTLKYRPAFPERFGSIQDARAHCHLFFPLVQHRAPSFGPRSPDAG